MMNAPIPDLRGKQRTRAVPPEPPGLMADVDTPVEPGILLESVNRRIPVKMAPYGLILGEAQR